MPTFRRRSSFTDLTVADLLANQDYDVPGDFNPARIQAMLDEWAAARK